MPKLEIMPNQTGQLGTGSQTGAEFKADLKNDQLLSRATSIMAMSNVPQDVVQSFVNVGRQLHQ